MKVEFVHSELYGVCLKISYNECIKALKDDYELDSMITAVEAFMVSNDIGDYFNPGHYLQLIELMQKGSFLLFTAVQQEFIRINRLVVLMSFEGIPSPILFWNGDGYVIADKD